MEYLVKPRWRPVDTAYNLSSFDITVSNEDLAQIYE